MKITHLCFVSLFSDGYSYQENILPLYHKKLDTMLASLLRSRSMMKGESWDLRTKLYTGTNTAFRYFV